MLTTTSRQPHAIVASDPRIMSTGPIRLVSQAAGRDSKP